jgi:hypothetical protein
MAHLPLRLYVHNQQLEVHMLAITYCTSIIFFLLNYVLPLSQIN